LDQLLIVIGSVVRAVKSHSSGKKPNFDPKPQKSRNDSSYQLLLWYRQMNIPPEIEHLYRTN